LASLHIALPEEDSAQLELRCRSLPQIFLSLEKGDTRLSVLAGITVIASTVSDF
jgi:hypothetical protein